MRTRYLLSKVAFGLLLPACCCAMAPAAPEWRDSLVDYRVGNPWRTPFNPNRFPTSIFSLTRQTGPGHGASNFNLSLLPADEASPGVLMLDAALALGYRKHAFRIGIVYPYGNSKPGNPWMPVNGQWYRMGTPTLRAEYNFR